MEQNIFFSASDGIELEGALFSGNDRAAILAHPHPLYGGNMDNLVVCEIAAACRARGLTTLRFNFRGAGKSQGAYDQGTGEQKDLLAAVDHVRSRGARAIDLRCLTGSCAINKTHKPQKPLPSDHEKN